jgi:uncharacterized protein YukE
MSVSYHDVRRWSPDALDAAAKTIRERKERVLALEDELSQAFGPLFWGGEAANAARDTLQAIRDRAERVVAEAGTVQRALYDAADAVIELKNQVADVDSTASGNQFSIGPDGSVTDTATTPATPERAQQASAIADAVAGILGTAQQIDDALAAVLNSAEQGTIAAEDADTLAEADPTQQTGDGHYRIGPPDRPQIQWDEDFVYDSKEPGFGDELSKAKWLAQLRGAQLLGHLPDGTAMYEHYWKNTGEPKEFDYEKAYREDSGVRNGVDTEIARAARGAEELIRNGNTEFSITGKASAVPDQFYPTTENWQKAIGGYQTWSHANVRVEGNTVTMEITVEGEDHYNFNRGQADIGSGASDDENGRFTEVGWAKPFDVHGQLTRTVTWELGDPPPDPSGQPGEDREPRGRERDRGPTPDNPRERR